jgi:hypothetical protein
MEQSLYIFLFIITLGILFLAQYKVKVPTDKFLLFIISGILFLALMIQSFNIEIVYYDPNISQFVSYRIAENGYEYLLPLGICFITASFSLLSAIILIPQIWNKNFQNKDLRGFK